MNSIIIALFFALTLVSAQLYPKRTSYPKPSVTATILPTGIRRIYRDYTDIEHYKKHGEPEREHYGDDHYDYEERPRKGNKNKYESVNEETEDEHEPKRQHDRYDYEDEYKIKEDDEY